MKTDVMKAAIDDRGSGSHGSGTFRRRHSSFAHTMPFGPEPVVEDGRRIAYRFRLWAPAEKHVEVYVVDESGTRSVHPCTKADGWHSCTVAGARPGDRYGFCLDHQLEVPDPASRFNPDGVHGPSELVDPERFRWDSDWRGRPWEEAVIYELHVGAFTPEGTYAGAATRLEGLAALGVTAIELMPLAEFAGRRGWGYDGVLPFAPKAEYGTPDELKRFVQAAHRLGLMVLLDVVYNHFGPEGNYLHVYAPQFFSARYETPWGAAIDYETAAPVREFFIHNALYWLEEYRFDGLRIDAAHCIFDSSSPDILTELSTRVREQIHDRPVHLILENVANSANRLGRPGQAGRYDAQWNDDFHHAAHVLLTGEHEGYYADYAGRALHQFVRCLCEGFAFQGDSSVFHGAERGEPSTGLPLSAFVNYLQNHDQVGNRAFGERLVTLVEARRLRALIAIQLLTPSPPLIFMGEEAGATTPFRYFCDYQGELAVAIREGRRREFGVAPQTVGQPPAELPDPAAEEAFRRSKLDWAAYDGAEGKDWQDFYQRLLSLRQRFVTPRIPLVVPGRCRGDFVGPHAFEVRWACADGSALALRANLANAPSPQLPDPHVAPFAAVGPDIECGHLGPWCVRAYVWEPSDG
ncbi:malto-oligosyltrehalose trehalohydrolase [Azoarcus sp. KH32C]|uniref:malto-oligosyltrehalose trehalohydrolase n=1 Tax=Azoarcus sp. KH32C TaxID=748247 RepID=UPI0012EA90F4|nr:malto-oligosyltrehalose trehalohydrolase [Azoarcus sp. KH32C]